MTTRGNDGADYVEDEISLRPYFETLWGYRLVIGAAAIGVATLFVIGVLWVFLTSPVERVGSIQFRLLFDGASKGEYPNGTPFSPSEIVAAPVLTEVFKANELQRYGSFAAFKDSVFVLQSNPALDMLGLEYQARLADTRLTAVDRARIEDEFRKKREAIVDPVFSINMRRSERLTSVPRDLMDKTLLDILNTWAKQADERKGATRYNVAVLSTNILQREVLDREDYLVAIDILRSKTRRVIETLDAIGKLPGANAIRVGEKQVTLGEVRAGLEDVIRFRLEPLLGVIRSDGVTKNAKTLSLYANNQLFQLRLEKEEAAERIRGLQEAVRAFSAGSDAAGTDSRASAPRSGAGGGSAPAVTPQVDRSFLDQVIAMSTAEEDSEYKRGLTDRIIEETEKLAAKNREAAYYEDLVSELRAAGWQPNGSPDVVALIKTRSSDAFDEIARGIEQTAAIYRELSALNLNPSTTVLTVTGPFALRADRSLTLRTVVLYFGLLMLLTLIVVPIGCLVHHAFRK